MSVSAVLPGGKHFLMFTKYFFLGGVCEMCFFFGFFWFLLLTSLLLFLLQEQFLFQLNFHLSLLQLLLFFQ